MRVFRFLLAAVVIVAAMFTGFFALAVVAVIGLVAMVVQSIRRRRMTTTTREFPFDQTHRETVSSSSGEVIDVEATEATVVPEPRLPADNGH